MIVSKNINKIKNVSISRWNILSLSLFIPILCPFPKHTHTIKLTFSHATIVWNVPMFVA